MVTNRQVTFNFCEANLTAPVLNRNSRFSIQGVVLPESKIISTTRVDQAVTRPIHYLGSKLRIKDLVSQAIESVAPYGEAVCDLFAGSGTVSRALSHSRRVMAVDIQEYSRVICSALLNPVSVAPDCLAQFLDSAKFSEHSKKLSWAIEPIAAHEARCRTAADAGEVESLCDFLEQASYLGFVRCPESITDADLRTALKKTKSRLNEAGLSESPESMVVRYYGGVYFSFIQAAQIDMLLEAASKLSPFEKDVFLAAILSTASEVVNTVGKQFAQPIRPRGSDGKPKKDLAKRVARDRSDNVFEVFENWIVRYLATSHSEKKHEVLRSDYKEALKNLHNSVGVVYADPPYTRDHYSRYYHVLETLCLRDCPSISTIQVNGREQISRGIYRMGRHQSPFCIKSQAPGAFSSLLAGVRNLGVPLVLSYSPFEAASAARPRLMAVDHIQQLAKKFFSSVEIWTADEFAHSKLNRSERNTAVSYGAENLLLCKP